MPGPFYFAWCDVGDEFNDAVHNVEDEQIFSFEIAQEEGEFATLTIEIANPHVGLLAAGRKVWCWFSWDNGTSIVPLFNGRLVGIPDSITNDVVTLIFVARPVDYDTQKAALAEYMRVAPYYNEDWIAEDKRDDADTVLEGYSALWHIDRVTLDVSTSDIIVGEDGVLTPTPLQVFFDGFSLKLNQVPLSSITIDATIGWNQAVTGSFKLKDRVFEDPRAHKLLSDWPKAGTEIEGGWKVTAASAVDMLNSENAKTISGSSSWESKAAKHQPGDTTSISMSWTFPEDYKQTTDSRPQILTAQTQGGVVSTVSANASYYWTVRYKVATSITIAYDVKRARTEVLTLVATSDFQSILTDPGEDQFDSLSLNTTISDNKYAYHFATDAGALSIEYLLSIARARLLARARVVEITCECPFVYSLDFSLRKNFQLNDARLPGGTAVGKIIAYAIKGSGDSGEFFGEVSFACCIGRGTSVTVVAGDPVYADSYVADGYQIIENQTTVLTAGDIGYVQPASYVADDGIKFPAAKSSVINEIVGAATYELRTRKLDNGPFNAPYALTSSPLVAPKQIDLEAAS